MGERWIVIPGWDRFQHYRHRDPPWIKLHRGLASDPEWLRLTPHQRAVLIGLWLEYASTHCQVRVNTASLSRRLGLRVSSRQLETLNHAGFIAFSASKPLAPRYQDAIPEAEREKDTKAVTSTTDVGADDAQTNGNGPGINIPLPTLKGVDPDEW